MFIIMLFALVLLPILEIYVLIESGRLIGVAPTVLLVILTSVAGSVPHFLEHGLVEMAQGMNLI